jgi:hypothetical protein
MRAASLPILVAVPLASACYDPFNPCQSACCAGPSVLEISSVEPLVGVLVAPDSGLEGPRFTVDVQHAYREVGWQGELGLSWDGEAGGWVMPGTIRLDLSPEGGHRCRFEATITLALEGDATSELEPVVEVLLLDTGGEVEVSTWGEWPVLLGWSGWMT